MALGNDLPRSNSRSLLRGHPATPRPLWLVSTIGFLRLQACATPQAPSSSGDAARNTSSTDASTPRAPKRLTVGILQEPQTWAPWVTTTTAGGANQAAFLIKRTLTTQSQDGQ